MRKLPPRQLRGCLQKNLEKGRGNSMEKENVFDMAMALIAGAGDSKSDSMEAIQEAKNGNFKRAEELLEQASSQLSHTHEIQTDLIREEMMGNSQEATLLMVHAQDHLNSALLMRDLADEFKDMYQMIWEIRKGGTRE